MDDVEQRFWSHVDVRDPDECWPWLASLDRGGYGKFWFGGRCVGAHRVAYEFHLGPIPEGLDLDHECHNRDESCPGGTCPHRACCNPAHHAVASARENVLRGKTPAAMNARKTHCPRGHAYDEVNTYVFRNSRGCRACRRKSPISV